MAVPLVAVCVPAATARLFADAVMVDPFRPNETLFEFEKVKALARLLVVPAERLTLAWVLATVTLAVTTDELLIPNVTLFEFEKTTVPLVAVCVPAAAARLFADAVIVEAFKPNETLFEFEKVKALARFDVVPAERLMLAWVLATVTLAVTTDELLIPNVTLFELEKTTVPLVAVCVPAAIAPGAVLCEKLAEAVIVDASRPKLTLFAFAKVKALARFDVVPAERLTLAAAAAKDAVTIDESLIPNVTPFEFEKTTVPVVAT